MRKEANLDFWDSIATAEAIEKARLSGELETASFAMGCFWSPDANLGRIPGVVQTRVGYAGGLHDSPSYGEVRDHAETVRVVFHHKTVKYAALLEEFARYFQPSKTRSEGQYRPLIIASTPLQDKAASEFSQQAWGAQGPAIIMHDDPRARFWDAEAYHQKHRLRRNAPLTGKLEADLGPRWDEHLWATKLNSADSSDFDAQRWFERVPPAIKEAFRHG